MIKNFYRFVMQWFLVALFIITVSVGVKAQQLNTISTTCLSPDQLTKGRINFVRVGDVNYRPCPGRTNFFFGNVDFSGAVIVGGAITSLNGLTTPVQLLATGTSGTDFNISSATATHTFNLPTASATNRGALSTADWSTFNSKVGGSGTANFVPRFTAGSTLGNTPFSWDGTIYSLNNTAVNAQFIMDLTPSVAAGVFRVGDYTTTPTTFFTLTQSTNTINLATTAANGIFDVNTFGSSNINARFANANSSFTLNAGAGANASFALEGSTNTVTLRGLGGMALDSGTGANTIGDVNNNGNRTKLIINDTSQSYTFGNASNAGLFLLQEIIDFQLFRTITPAATTGAQTINRPNGTVNFAAAATAIVVTNSMALATSTIIVTQQDTDATCINFHVDAKANGSFTIRSSVACTAETPVAFWVFN